MHTKTRPRVASTEQQLHLTVENAHGLKALADPSVSSVSCHLPLELEPSIVRQWASSWDAPLRVEATSEEWLMQLRTALRDVVPKGPVTDKVVDHIRVLTDCWPGAFHGERFRFFFGPVRNGMCRRFHTDINEARLLSTLVGPATDLLDSAPPAGADIDAWVEDHPQKIIRVQTGRVVLLKGALWEHPTPNANDLEDNKRVVHAAWHRSPPMDGDKAFRLLFRMDPVSSLDLAFS